MCLINCFVEITYLPVTNLCAGIFLSIIKFLIVDLDTLNSSAKSSESNISGRLDVLVSSN
jgi:hypothetical protein